MFQDVWTSPQWQLMWAYIQPLLVLLNPGREKWFELCFQLIIRTYTKISFVFFFFSQTSIDLEMDDVDVADARPSRHPKTSSPKVPAVSTISSRPNPVKTASPKKQLTEEEKKRQVLKHRIQAAVSFVFISLKPSQARAQHHCYAYCKHAYSTLPSILR